MRIEHITRRFVRSSWGGTESAVLALAQQLQSSGHRSGVLTSMALAETRQEDVGGVTVTRFQHFYPYLGLGSGARERLDMTAGNLFSFPLLKHLLVAPPADVYHLHTGKRMGGIVRVAARRHRRPYVVSLHGGLHDVPPTERQRWTEPTDGAWEWGRLLGAAVGARRVLEDAAAILCVNRVEQRALQEQFPGKRVLWTPNTVDVNRYSGGCGARFRSRYGIPAEAKIILNVARIDEQKNQLATVEIFNQLAVGIPDLHLVFAGPPTSAAYAERLRKAIAASVFASQILCLGNVDSGSTTLVDMYDAADVFFLNSLHEPFGIVLLEAWAAGLPVVAPRVGGIPSFVDDGQTGLLFEPEDLGTAARHIFALLSDAMFARGLSSKASERVKDFDSSRSTADLIQLYEEVRHEHPLCA